MRILIDINHPAHVHYYRNLAGELTSKGHRVYWTARDLAIVKDLLGHYGFTYSVLRKPSSSLAAKAFKQVLNVASMLRFVRRQEIDLAIGTSVSISHLSLLSKVASVLFDDDDDDVQPLVSTFPNASYDYVVCPDALRGRKKRKSTIFYPGYQELAYLHPNRFAPDPGVLEEAGLETGAPFFVMRFNAFRAHHDIGARGLTLAQKLALIETLKPHGRILITTERKIEPELEPYQLPVRPEKVHSLMSYATLFLGDSQTMTSEAAVLGVPALKCNTFAGRLSVPNEMERKYGLCFSYLPADFGAMLKQLSHLLERDDLRSIWREKKEAMLKEKIDVTSFWLWLIDGFPDSFHELRKNPDLASQF